MSVNFLKSKFELVCYFLHIFMIEYIILKAVHVFFIWNKNNTVQLHECMYLWTYPHIHMYTYNSFSKQENSDTQ